MGYFLKEKCVYLRDVGLNLFALTATTDTGHDSLCFWNGTAHFLCMFLNVLDTVLIEG